MYVIYSRDLQISLSHLKLNKRIFEALESLHRREIE